MQRLDVAGFRGMQNIHQMMFENAIQLFLQVYIYISMEIYHSDFKVVYKFDSMLIMTSITLSCIHICMELFILSLESKAVNVTFFDYCVTCYNGRLGFVPFTDFIAKQYEKGKGADVELDYGKIQAEFC